MADFVANFDLENNEIESDFDLEQTQFDAILELNPVGASWGSITGNIENQTDLKEALDEKANVSAVEIIAENVSQNTSNISDINNTLNSFGDIVTYNASSFATSEQGEKADTALQPNDNISELINDVGYITSSALEGYATTTELTNGLAEKQDTISDLSDIRSNAENGQSAYTTIQSYGDIVTYNADNFATSIQGGLADTALQPNDDITELNNNAGYITSASLPTVNNNKVTIQKNSIDVGSFTLNQSTDKTINLSIPTQASDINAVPTSRKVNNKALSSDITLSASDVSALPSSTTINDLTTSTQQDALNSGATSTNIGQIATNTSDITAIEGLIPVQATTINQLADKSFVNSSIATNTAYFIGTFNSVADLEAYSGTLTNNDYAFVETTDSAGNTLYDRYKYTTATTPASWQFEYELNNSSFTSNQWASINSGITANDVTLIGTAIQPNDNVSSLTNDAGYITSSSLPTVNNGTLTIQQNGTDVQTFTANQSTNATANITVPTDTNDLTNGAGYITGIDSTDISNALGYTPANASKVIDYYGTCDTSANTQAKEVTCSDFVLATGASIRVKFTNNQSFNGAPTLNVNSTGAYTVQSMSGTDALRYCWRAGEVVAFTFDGSNWLMEDGALATVTYYGYTRLTSSATSVSTTTALTPWSLSMLVQNMIEPYPIYSANSTYAVGDRVRYDMNAWECNTPITEPEAWTVAHWTKLDDIQTQLDNSITYGSIIQDANQYNSKKLQFSKLDNTFYKADRRHTITLTGFQNNNTKSYLFDGSWESSVKIDAEGTGVINITGATNLDMDYPYGWLYVSFASTYGISDASMVSARVYQNRPGTFVGWVDLTTKEVVNYWQNKISVVRFKNSNIYGVEQVEITINNSTGTSEIWVDQVEFFPSRTQISSLPVVTKYGNSTIYGTVASDGFIGDVTGNALSATKLGTTDVGSNTTPIYLDDGVATASTYTIEKSVPSNAVFTDTTYSAFTGADSITGGASGLVPAPSAGDEGKYLKGDGTWATVSSGSSTDVQINGTSITSGGVANIVTNTAYNASSNKIATMSDVPSISGLANTDLSNLSSTGNGKFQAPLVSGSNIKTINSTSLLGSGNISISGGHTWTTTRPSTSSTASSTNPAVVVTNYYNGSSWYRVWSDKFIEQGGYVSKGSTLAKNAAWDQEVFLLKTFYSLSADYTLLITYSYGTSASGEAGQEFFTYKKNYNKFTAHLYNRNSGTAMPSTISFNWYACGYGD